MPTTSQKTQKEFAASSHCSAELKRQFNIIDMLKTNPPTLPFIERVKAIGLSDELVAKVIRADQVADDSAKPTPITRYLLERDEKELAGEVLLCRHEFTNVVFENRFFRQAALSVIQNIYLFQQRKIYFCSDLSAEQERQDALALFSRSPGKASIPFAKTFQHLVITRVWHRIICQASDTLLQEEPFRKLHQVVERLNTLRNIYMLLSLGLTHKLARSINRVYQQSITFEDARQIGNFGIARAAYRYHPSSGLRFSTYASWWIRKELQRQALDGRLIRVSASLVERASQEARSTTSSKPGKAYGRLNAAAARLTPNCDDLPHSHDSSIGKDLSCALEQQEISTILLGAIKQVLSPKSGDVVMRRYGLGPYQGRAQSVIAIAQKYAVTRGSIYQLEQTALNKLKDHITKSRIL